MLVGDPFYVGPYLITPHPRAPLFADEATASKYVTQVFSSMQTHPDVPSKELYDLVRQLGFTSLYFFLSVILSPTGPYDKLSDPLSMDMCNFRQSKVWEQPHARAAAFIPRGMHKSTVFTHGGDTWDLLRDPDERVLIANAVSDKAQEFLHIVQRSFDSSSLLAYFYPEYIVSRNNGGQVTDKVLVLPNRSRNFVEPSLRTHGLTGASEGGHFTLISMDDLVGLDATNAQHASSALMDTAKKWFRTNQHALCLDQASRIGVAATRYAMDDCYQDIYSSCHTVTGWTKEDIVAKPSGGWDIYYRLVEEDGVWINPEVMNKKSFSLLLKDDYFSAMAQYYNAPKRGGLAEFAEAQVRECELRWDEQSRQFWIDRKDSNFDPKVPTSIALRSCDVIMTTDLAATDKGINAKICRTSIGVWARDSYGNSYRLWGKVGFFSIFQTFDYIFEGWDLFQGAIRVTYIEDNGFQKIVRPLIEREQITRNKWIHPTGAMAQGDKKARIRSAFGPRLMRNQIWSTDDAGIPLREELGMFPMSESRVDCLDESEKALTNLITPMTTEEREVIRAQEIEETSGFNNAFGY